MSNQRIRHLSRCRGRGILTFISVLSLCGLEAQGSDVHDGTMFPADAVLFSPRFVTRPGITTDQYLQMAQRFHATDIVWHYGIPNTALILKARKMGFRVNCALPAATPNPIYACKNSKGILVKNVFGTYIPDVSLPAWRSYVLAYIKTGYAAGCSSYQQDEPWLTGRDQARDVGCRDYQSQKTVQDEVMAYTRWVHAQLNSIYGRQVLVSYNRFFKKNQDPDRLAKIYSSAMAEINPELNSPSVLFDLVYLRNKKQDNIESVTTLRENNKAHYLQHLATMYSIGGHAIAPYDVFLKPDLPRIYCNPLDYDSYFSFIRKNGVLFRGYHLVDAYMDDAHTKSNQAAYKGKIRGDTVRSDVALVLRKNQNKYVLHMVNWRAQPRILDFKLDRSIFNADPRHAYIYRPGQETIVVPLERSGNTIELSVVVPVWAIVEFR